MPLTNALYRRMARANQTGEKVVVNKNRNKCVVVSQGCQQDQKPAVANMPQQPSRDPSISSNFVRKYSTLDPI
jgi:hypothetical protein